MILLNLYPPPLLTHCCVARIRNSDPFRFGIAFSGIWDNLDRASLSFSEIGALVQLLCPTKTQSRTALRLIHLNRLKDLQNCPVHALETYFRITSDLGVKSKKVFVSYRQPYDSLTPSTIGRWVLKLAGIDVSIFSAHSTKRASTSRLLEKGTPIEEILKAANWRSESTFTRFYRREILK